MSRFINLLVVHCAATTATMDIGVKEIRGWHLARGFADVGYHYVIRRNGVIEKGRDDETIGAHVEGYNAHSLGVCMVGGCKKGANGKLVAENNFTPAQFAELKLLLERLETEHPKARICGHRDLNPGKDCPSFSVRDWLVAEGVPHASGDEPR